ncbi:MAG: serine/threonine protein kinase, partial [Aphanothece sp. CMT-3BRIN-NPC111]|nr:serine/threonine protein kinase [Aphanothece sp. CMT-3BRIN-NPC111]
MLYCLNPDCDQPHNPDGINFCQNCGVKTVSLLRNRYRIINIIGSGGFGRTLLAEDIDKLNERCVVKQLAPNVQGNWALNKAKQLFEQEARRLQQLGNHPQIPSLYSYFEEDGRLYLVQELIDGHNLLMELKQQGVFSERKIRALLDNVLDILQVVHQQNVIHRDIKPENIMRRNPQQGLNKGGDLVLIDFGVAKQATASVMSKPGTTIGSFGYSSIEQMQGGETYPASDLFSLGATCFHLLSNIHPHDLFINEGYSWVQNWRQHLQQPISANLTFVLDKLLEKDYQKRFQSAAEVKKDLHPQPQVSPPPTIPAVPPTIPVKPKPQQRVSPPPTIPVAPKPPLPKPKPWLKVSIVLLFGLGLWQFLPQMKNVISRPSSPAKTINYENLALATTLSGHSNWVHSVAFSPDGQSLASGSDDKTLKIWDVATGKVKSTLTGHSDRVYSVAFSPDGQSLASGSDDKTLKIWEVATGKVKSTLTGHSDRVNSVAFSLDG